MKRIFGILAILAAVMVGPPLNATDLSVETISLTSLAATYNGSLSATPASYRFRNDGKTFLHVKKTAAVDCVLTFTTPNTVGGVAVADPTVTVVATTGDKVIGPFSPGVFNDASGFVTFVMSDVDGVTIAVIRFP